MYVLPLDQVHRGSMVQIKESLECLPCDPIPLVLEAVHLFQERDEIERRVQALLAAV